MFPFLIITATKECKTAGSPDLYKTGGKKFRYFLHTLCPFNRNWWQKVIFFFWKEKWYSWILSFHFMLLSAKNGGSFTTENYFQTNLTSFLLLIRGGSRTAATSKMERFVNGYKPLTIIGKRSILDVAAVLDPPLTYASILFPFQKLLF